MAAVLVATNHVNHVNLVQLFLTEKQMNIDDLIWSLLSRSLDSRYLIIEVKAVQTLCKAHEVQLVNYLTATRIDNGLLINFGPSVQVRRKFREFRPRE